MSRADYLRAWKLANPERVAGYQAAAREKYAALADPLERVCANAECGLSFTPSRRDAKTCSRKCRDRLAYLRRQGAK